jgi:myosin heavy subunit
VFLPCYLLPRHGDFVSRYKILLPREQQDIVLASEQQTRAAVLQLLAVFKVPDGQYEMGRTKVFFKPGGCHSGVNTCYLLHALHGAARH